MGLRAWDQIKTSKNAPGLWFFLWVQSCLGEAHTERPVQPFQPCFFFFSCLGEVQEEGDTGCLAERVSVARCLSPLSQNETLWPDD